MTAKWPTVKARLVAAIPALPAFATVTVFNGPPTERPNLYMTIGYVEDGEFGGTFDAPDSTITALREESGVVVSELIAWSGDGDLQSLEDSVFALFNAIDAWVRADQTLSVLGAGATATLSGTFVPVLTKGAGPTARLIVTLSYFARS